MSELINTKDARADFRWQLLTTVSVFVICGAISAGNAARADDADRSTVWIELGGQLERVQGKQDAFLPPFLQSEPRPGFEVVPPAVTQRPARYAFGGEAKMIFAPTGSDWSFLAGVRFGRSNGSKQLHQQTTEQKQTGVTKYGKPFYVSQTRFGDTVAANSESHTIVDFMAGRDVGLGFGRNSTASFDFGVRFAQFGSKSAATLREAPDPYIVRIPQPPNPFFPTHHKYTTNTHHHTFFAQDSITRSFSGIGPSISLSGTSPVVGSADEVEIAFDWGANAAVLFGRQKVHGSHKTKGSYFTNHFSIFGYAPKTGYAHTVPVGRSRTRVVPNIGGFAGLTFRHADAKVSFGYRADFFIGAVDGGISAPDTGTVSFHGPFATISIGLGG
jgi:hypothetical protein